MFLLDVFTQLEEGYSGTLLWHDRYIPLQLLYFLPLQLSTSINIMDSILHEHRHHYITTTAAANTPPLPLILTSTILEQGQSFSFVVGGLIATSNHFFLDLPLNSKPPLKNGAPWQSTIIWAYYTDGSPSLSVPTASDNSIGPLRGRAWSLVPPTRRTTSTHHPLSSRRMRQCGRMMGSTLPGHAYGHPNA